jgi:hypothetical protein
MKYLFAFQKVFGKLTTSLSESREITQRCEAKAERQLSHERDSPGVDI